MIAYHLEGNGLVEKQYSRTTWALKACINEQAHWYDCPHSITLFFTGAQHHSTGIPPTHWCLANRWPSPSSWGTDHSIVKVMTWPASIKIRQELDNIDKWASLKLSTAKARKAKQHNMRHIMTVLTVSSKVILQAVGGSCKRKQDVPSIIETMHHSRNLL